MPKLVINIDEEFQNFPHAPIVEAVIDIRAIPTTVLEEATLKSNLESRLNGYRFLDSMQHFQIQHDVSLQGGPPSSPIIRELSWKGLRFQSEDKKHIAQFNRDGFVFSRLEPYQSWGQFYEEGTRLWCVYTEFARPNEIQRIGLRYINRIQLPVNEMRFEDYLQPAPEPPKDLDLPFSSYLHQDTLVVPDHPYAINIIRTIQPPEVLGAQGLGLILDIDAFTTEGFELDEQLLKRRLLDMRWLKNKVFFGSVTSNARQLFQ